ncbi:MAG: class I SAM-dependent methyltransferase [Myxococcota bacterium]|nr:class I SAM-dependent methyltransferase [Myxococcota bacterium]
MSLCEAKTPEGEPIPIAGDAPYPCENLHSVAGLSFRLPCGDPRLEPIHFGGSASSPPLDNLVGMVAAWGIENDWLDFLDPNAPNHHESMLERDLYLQHWKDFLPTQGRVLDLGGGIGRFTRWLVGQGLEVELVDPDLRSLWRAVQHASGTPGRLDVHWSTGEHLPEIAPVDVAIAAEVLCYTEDPRRILNNIAKALVPGGLLLLSVEARWGWASSLDVAPDTLDALMSDGIVHVPGDRWIKTYEKPELESLLSDWEILSLLPTHYVSSGPFEAAAGDMNLQKVLAWEQDLRGLEQTRHLNRAWTAVARAPWSG